MNFAVSTNSSWGISLRHDRLYLVQWLNSDCTLLSQPQRPVVHGMLRGCSQSHKKTSIVLVGTCWIHQFLHSIASADTEEQAAKQDSLAATRPRRAGRASRAPSQLDRETAGNLPRPSILIKLW